MDRFFSYTNSCEFPDPGRKIWIRQKIPGSISVKLNKDLYFRYRIRPNIDFESALSGNPIRDILGILIFPDHSALAVMSYLFFANCPVLAVVSLMSCSGCLVLTILSCLAALSWFPCPGCLFRQCLSDVCIH